MYKFKFYIVGISTDGDFETEPFVISDTAGRFDITDSVYDFLESRGTRYFILSSEPFEGCESANYVRDTMMGPLFAIKFVFYKYKHYHEEIEICQISLIKLFGEVPKTLYFQTY